MNFAEGKGPKNVKKKWPLGQFVTIYGNGNPANVYSPGVPYPSAISGTNWGATTTALGGIPGSAIPGLNLNVNGNGATDVGFVCSPGSNESIQDIETTVVTLTAEAGWSGTATVTLQGTQDRYTGNTVYTSTNWVNIVSGTVTAANIPILLKVPSASGILYNAYRVIGSGGTGIIDWAIGGMFTDFSAMGIGNNAADANGNAGQMSIQFPRNIAISGGAITSVTGTNPPYENLKTNHTWVG